MTVRTNLAVAATIIASLTGWAWANQAETTTASQGLRIGVYDSRAVAIAYAGSPVHDRILKAKMAERDKAKAAGNEDKVKELEAWGQEQQQRMHLQGFGSAPVTDILAHIKEKFPQIAADAGVDLIVSKWQIDYINPDIQTVDITLRIIEPFEPKAKALQWIEQLKDKAPLSDEDIDRHGHNH